MSHKMRQPFPCARAQLCCTGGRSTATFAFPFPQNPLAPAPLPVTRAGLYQEARQGACVQVLNSVLWNSLNFIKEMKMDQGKTFMTSGKFCFAVCGWRVGTLMALCLLQQAQGTCTPECYFSFHCMALLVGGEINFNQFKWE